MDRKLLKHIKNNRGSAASIVLIGAFIGTKIIMTIMATKKKHCHSAS